MDKPETEDESGDKKTTTKPETNHVNEFTESNEPAVDDTKANEIAESETKANDVAKETVEFKVVFNKIKYDIKFPLEDTIDQLKLHLQEILGVPQAMQKLMFKGLAKDSHTLKEVGITKGSKVMVVGSTIDAIMAVTTPSKQVLAEEEKAASTSEPFCKQKMHRKVLDKGVPEDAMPGLRGVQSPLPSVPLSGMLNKSGGKVRLTFKLDQDTVWIGTKDRTDKIPLTSIKGVVSEPIEQHEEYHMLAMQLGTTDASRYWVYWVPAQYVDAIKDAILGKWQLF